MTASSNGQDTRLSTLKCGFKSRCGYQCPCDGIWNTYLAKNQGFGSSSLPTDTNGGRAVPAANYVFRQLPVYILSVCFRKCLNNKNQYGDRRLMVGHQIVDLSIRVRFPSITLPAVPVSILCSGSLRFTIWFIRFRQSFAYRERIWASKHSGDCSGL